MALSQVEDVYCTFKRQNKAAKGQLQGIAPDVVGVALVAPPIQPSIPKMLMLKMNVKPTKITQQ